MQYCVIYGLYIDCFHDSTEQKREIDFIFHGGLLTVEGARNTR